MARLLIVDDNAAFADNLAEILGDYGNDVAIADSGEGALALAQKDHFDVLISDMRMPKMSGLALIRAIRQIDVGLPAVVVSAYSADQEEAVQRAGIMEVLPKPVPIPKLLQVIGKARRNGVVAIIAEDHALVERLSQLMRDHGFAPVAASTTDELQALGGLPLLAVVVGPRVSEASLLALFPALPAVPSDSDQLVEMLEDLHASHS